MIFRSGQVTGKEVGFYALKKPVMSSTYSPEGGPVMGRGILQAWQTLGKRLYLEVKY